MENEIWKPIYGVLGYEASNFGNIRNANTGYVRKPFLHWKGYHTVGVSILGRHKNLRVHKAIMLAFVGPSNLQVNHINGVKTDNRLENLEYVTASQNIRHSRNVLGQSGNRKMETTPVIQLSLSGDFINRFPSGRFAARETGIDQSQICKSCKYGKIAGGFIWKHEKNNIA